MPLNPNKDCKVCSGVLAEQETIKEKQKARDLHIEAMHRDINSRVGISLFLSAMAIIVAFLGYNAVQNNELKKDMAVAQVLIEQVAKTQVEMKEIMKQR